MFNRAHENLHSSTRILSVLVCSLFATEGNARDHPKHLMARIVRQFVNDDDDELNNADAVVDDASGARSTSNNRQTVLTISAL